MEKNYYLNVIKEVTVTKSFLSMDKQTRQCQEETYDYCTTKNYLDALIKKCECLPLQIRNTNEVKF